MENERKEGLKGRINYNPALSHSATVSGEQEKKLTKYPRFWLQSIKYLQRVAYDLFLTNVFV